MDVLTDLSPAEMDEIKQLMRVHGFEGDIPDDVLAGFVAEELHNLALADANAADGTNKMEPGFAGDDLVALATNGLDIALSDTQDFPPRDVVVAAQTKHEDEVAGQSPYSFEPPFAEASTGVHTEIFEPVTTSYSYGLLDQDMPAGFSHEPIPPPPPSIFVKEPPPVAFAPEPVAAEKSAAPPSEARVDDGDAAHENVGEKAAARSSKVVPGPQPPVPPSNTNVEKKTATKRKTKAKKMGGAMRVQRELLPWELPGPPGDEDEVEAENSDEEQFGLLGSARPYLGDLPKDFGNRGRGTYMYTDDNNDDDESSRPRRRQSRSAKKSRPGQMARTPAKRQQQQQKKVVQTASPRVPRSRTRAAAEQRGTPDDKPWRQNAAVRRSPSKSPSFVRSSPAARRAAARNRNRSSRKKKHDPVARYHELQRTWCKDKFLSGGSGSGRKTTKKQSAVSFASPSPRKVGVRGGRRTSPMAGETTPEAGDGDHDSSSYSYRRVMQASPNKLKSQARPRPSTPYYPRTSKGSGVTTSPPNYVSPAATKRPGLRKAIEANRKEAAEDRHRVDVAIKNGRRRITSDKTVPTEKRRDGLRWQMRRNMMMQQQQEA